MTDDDQKLGPPPVEPMSDVAWARVERGLWSRIDSGATDSLPAAPPRRWLWLALPALAAAAILVVVIGAGLLSRRGDAPVISSSDPSEPSRVVAGAAPTAVSFGDAHIDLAAQSAIVMSREGDSPSVLLERGAAKFSVAPRFDRAPFVVRAGDTVVRVIGTRFVVSRSNEQITVAVEHGLVDVQFRGTTQRVGADQSWSSDSPHKVALQAAASGAPDTEIVASLTPPDRTNTSNTNAPNLDPTNTGSTNTGSTNTGSTNTGSTNTGSTNTGSTNPNVSANARPTSPDTRATAPDTRITSPGPRTTSPDTHTSTPTKTDARVTTRTPDTRTGSATAAAGSTGALVAASKDAERATYDRLSALEQRDPKAALTGYLELSRGNTKWSAVALFAAGRLAADRKDQRAVTFLDIYLRRFPNGANADDARNLLARLKGDIP